MKLIRCICRVHDDRLDLLWKKSIWPLDILFTLYWHLCCFHSLDSRTLSPFARSPVTNDPILIPLLKVARYGIHLVGFLLSFAYSCYHPP